MGPSGAPERPAPRWQTRDWLGFAAIALGVSSAPLDSAVNVAFPAIDTALGVGLASIHWVVICYVLTYASLLLGLGRLGDVAGHRVVFLAGIVVSILGLAACSLASQFEVFLAARVVQGVGSALVLATGPALTTLSAPASERTRMLALYMLAFGIANGAGPLIGGTLVQTFGWPSVFWFRIPILVLAGALAVSCLSTRIRPGPEWGPERGPVQRFEARSAALVAVAVAATLLFFVFSSRAGATTGTLALLVTAALSSALFVAGARRSGSAALIDMRLFAERAFAATNGAHVLVNAASFAVMLIVPFYLARQLGSDIASAGALLAMHPVGMALAPLPGRALIGKLGHRRTSLLGIATVSGALFAVSSWPEAAPWWLIAGTLLIGGLGHGLFQLSAMDLVMAVLGRAQQGVGGSLNMLTRTIGVVSAASAGTLLFATAQAVSFEHAFRLTFEVAAGVAAAAFVLLLVAWRSDALVSKRGD